MNYFQKKLDGFEKYGLRTLIFSSSDFRKIGIALFRRKYPLNPAIKELASKFTFLFHGSYIWVLSSTSSQKTELLKKAEKAIH